MKSFILAIAIALSVPSFQLQAQTADENQHYVVVDYMKVKDGKRSEYRACEKYWKTIHQNRKKMGHISGWDLQRVILPAGSQSEYDFITVTHFDNWDDIHKAHSYLSTGDWGKLTEGLSETERDTAMNASEYREFVKSEIWTGIDRVYPDDRRPRFEVENFMQVDPENWTDWIKMEVEMVKPVQQANMDAGNRAGWLLGVMVLPRGQNMEYQASTLDLYDSWEQMNNDESKAWIEAYPDMTQADVYKKFASLRTITRTEVRELIDYIE